MAWLTKDSLVANMSRDFKKAHHIKFKWWNYTWFEVFIERSNKLNAKHTTCFDHKLPDIIAFLVCTSTTGFPAFLFDTYVSTSWKKFECSDTIFQITWQLWSDDGSYRVSNSRRINLRILLINCDHKVAKQQLQSIENRNSTKF